MGLSSRVFHGTRSPACGGGADATIGGYLSGLLLVSGNLLVPIVAHALYDLVALTLLVRLKPTLASSVL